MKDKAIKDILTENERRNAIVYAKFNPITGEGSVGKRVKCTISDFPIHTQWLPERIMKVPLVRQLIEAGSISKFLTDYMGVEDNQDDRLKVIEQFVRIRSREDFPFWAATFVYIKAKGGGEDVLFRLTRPQRRFVDRLEKLRIAGKPIRIILLKARQWGGSTTSQLYMAWLQLLHKTGLNSLIIAHQGAGSDEIKDMFDRMIKSYPVEMLYKIDEAYNENEPKIVGVGKSGSIYRVFRSVTAKSRLVRLNARIRVVAVITILYISPKWEYGRLRRERNRKTLCAPPVRVFSSSPTP